MKHIYDFLISCQQAVWSLLQVYRLNCMVEYPLGEHKYIDSYENELPKAPCFLKINLPESYLEKLGFKEVDEAIWKQHEPLERTWNLPIINSEELPNLKQASLAAW